MQVQSQLFDVPILCYHYVEPTGVTPAPYSIAINQFEQQLDLLARQGFRTLNFSRLYELLQAGMRPPRKSVILTFDDGGRCFHERALPALKERGMTATVFLVAGEIGGINRWDTVKGGRERPLMDDAEILELVSHGIELGSHSWSHRAMPDCSKHELEQEMVESRRELEARFGQPITTFAYPYGRYRDAHHQMLEQAGYAGAVSIFSPYPTVVSNRFAMRRIAIHPGDHLLRFRLKLAVPYLKWVAFRDRKGNRTQEP